VQDLDLGAFDEAKLDQAAFQLLVRQRGARTGDGKVLDHTGITGAGQAERKLRPDVILFGHDLYFQSDADRSSAPVK
jgi:hypothetical protein